MVLLAAGHRPHKPDVDAVHQEDDEAGRHQGRQLFGRRQNIRLAGLEELAKEAYDKEADSLRLELNSFYST